MKQDHSHLSCQSDFGVLFVQNTAAHTQKETCTLCGAKFTPSHRSDTTIFTFLRYWTWYCMEGNMQ